MKRFKFNFKHYAPIHPLRKLTFLTVVLLAMAMSMPLNSNAQRRGGGGSGRGSFGGGGGSHTAMGGGSFSRIGGSHMNSGFSRSNGARMASRDFGHHGYYGRGYGYRGLPYWRYGYLPFWGDLFWGIPPYSFWFYLNGYNYYDCDGVYYKKDKDKYQVVPAPIGTKIKELPKNSVQFTMDGVPYYYYYGTFYAQVNDQYEVVEAPLGAEVDSIPDGYDKVMIDGQTYYTFDGVEYKAVMRNNVIWYQVIKNNNHTSEPQNASTNEPPMQKNNMTPK